MWLTRITFMVLWVSIISPAFSQPRPGYERIIRAAIEYPEMESFIKTSAGGLICIGQLAANNRIPQRGTVFALGQAIEIVPEADPEDSCMFEMKKLRINTPKARLSFIFNHNLKANFLLHETEGNWEVSRSWIRLKKTDETGNKIRRFHWDF
ncbi:MAG: hypothetical protein R3C61_08420 [Bacteroidia bacterium]